MIIFTALIAGSLGFFVGRYNPATGMQGAPIGDSNQIPTEDGDVPSSLFSSQTATIQGRILAVNENIVTIKTNKGPTVKVPLFEVYSVNQNGRTGTPSANQLIRTTPENEEVLVKLELIDKTMKITSIIDVPATTQFVPPTNP